jgi:uncharacterized protein YcbX
MRVQALYIHPVKACRALAVDELELGALGADLDRRFAFVADDGLALTQRDQPLLATVVPTVSHDALHLDLGGLAQVVLPFSAFREGTRVDVWGNSVAGRAVREDRLDDYLGARVRLVRLDPQSPRAFVDSRPVLVVTSAMLSDLNAQLDRPVGMERFRPNVVLDGDRAPEALRGADVALERDKPCGRCEVTTIDQTSGERRGPEPLRTLSERYAGHFGVYYRVVRAGRLRCGEVLQAA